MPLKVNRVGSMLSPYFTEQDVVNYETAQRSNMHQLKRYHVAMLDLGILTAPTPYEVMFVSTAHSDEDIENTKEAHYQALNTIKRKAGIDHECR